MDSRDVENVSFQYKWQWLWLDVTYECNINWYENCIDHFSIYVYWSNAYMSIYTYEYMYTCVCLVSVSH